MTSGKTPGDDSAEELARGFGEPFVRDDFDLASPCFACVLEGFDLDIVGNSLS